MLLGECKWGEGAVGRSVVRTLREKTGKVVPGEDWRVHYAVFARGGFTDAAREAGEEIDAKLVDLVELERWAGTVQE